MKLDDYISPRQRQQIVKTIVDRCREYQIYTTAEEKLFYGKYTVLRRKYNVTSAVLSAFSPMDCTIDGFAVEDINYGLNGMLCQPELKNEQAVIQLYSNGSNLVGKPISSRCKQYNRDFNSKPLFFIVQFFADEKGILGKIEILLPNQDGRIVERFELYKKPDLAVVSA